MAKTYKVEEVNSGICTCTLRAGPTQDVIADQVKQGWTFVQMQAIMGRRCGCIPSPKLLMVFSKEN
jgi:hypothetical protein